MTRNTSITALPRTCAVAVVAAAVLAACGGGSDQADVTSDEAYKSRSRSYTVGGTVTYSGPAGGAEGATLRVVAGNGSFADVTVDNVAGTAGTPVAYTFPKAFSQNQSYRVSVASQPDYLCTLTGVGSGTIRFSDITNANFSCQHVAAYPMRFDVSGLPSTRSVTVEYSNALLGDPVAKTVTGSGSFSFDDKFGEGATMGFRVSQQPANYFCRAPSTISAGATAAVAKVECTGIVTGF